MKGVHYDIFDLAFRGRRFASSARDEAEWLGYFSARPLPLADRYRLRMAIAMLDQGAFMFRCLACDRFTPVYFTRPSPSFTVTEDGAWRRYHRSLPWRTGSGTSCLWCEATMWRGWFTGRRFLRAGEVREPVPEDIMRRVLGEA